MPLRVAKAPRSPYVPFVAVFCCHYPFAVDYFTMDRIFFYFFFFVADCFLFCFVMDCFSAASLPICWSRQPPAFAFG